MNAASPSLHGRVLVTGLIASAVLAATGSTSVAAPNGAPLIRKTYAESRPGVAPSNCSGTVATRRSGTSRSHWLISDC